MTFMFVWITVLRYTIRIMQIQILMVSGISAIIAPQSPIQINLITIRMESVMCAIIVPISVILLSKIRMATRQVMHATTHQQILTHGQFLVLAALSRLVLINRHSHGPLFRRRVHMVKEALELTVPIISGQILIPANAVLTSLITGWPHGMNSDMTISDSEEKVKIVILSLNNLKRILVNI